MTGSIVQPSLIYLIGLFGNLNTAFGVLSFIFSIILCVVVPLYMFGQIENTKDAKKKIILFSVLFALSFVLCIVTPNKETIKNMIIADNITYERVEVAGEKIEDIYNDILICLEDSDKKGE